MSNQFFQNMAAGAQIGDALGQRLAERGLRRRARAAEEQYQQDGDLAAYEAALRAAETQGIARFRDVRGESDALRDRQREIARDAGARAAAQALRRKDNVGAENTLADTGALVADYDMARGGTIGAINARAAQGAVGADGVFRGDQAAQTSATDLGRAGFGAEAGAAQGGAVELGRQFRDIYMNEAFVHAQTGDMGAAAALVQKALEATPLVGSGNMTVQAFENAEDGQGLAVFRDGQHVINLTADDIATFMNTAGPERDALLTNTMASMRQSAATAATQSREDQVSYREQVAQAIRDFGIPASAADVRALTTAGQRATDAGMTVIGDAPSPGAGLDDGVIVEFGGSAQYVMRPGETAAYEFFTIDGQPVPVEEIRQLGAAGEAGVEYAAAMSAVARQANREDAAAVLRTQLTLLSNLYGAEMPGGLGTAGGQASGSPRAPAPSDGGQWATGANLDLIPGRAQLSAALAMAESSGGRNTVGPELSDGSRALGPMQILNGSRGPAADLARELGVPVEQILNDPETNVRAGNLYLDQLLQRFAPGSNPAVQDVEDQTTLALMSYNWGMGNVARWLQGGADPNAVPAETRDYVAKIRDMAPEAFGAAGQTVASAGAAQGGAGGGAVPRPGPRTPQERGPVSGTAGAPGYDDATEWNRTTIGTSGATALRASVDRGRAERDIAAVRAQLAEIDRQMDAIAPVPTGGRMEARTGALSRQPRNAAERGALAELSAQRRQLEQQLTSLAQASRRAESAGSGAQEQMAVEAALARARRTP